MQLIPVISFDRPDVSTSLHLLEIVTSVFNFYQFVVHTRNQKVLQYKQNFFNFKGQLNL